MYFEDVEVGQEIPSLRWRLTLPRLVAYAGASWDFHRSHYDPDYARSRGFPAPFADGQMLGALLARLIMDWAGADAFLRRLSFRFRSLVHPGEEIECRGRVVAKRVEGNLHLVVCDLSIVTTDGREVVAPASAEVDLPARG